MKLLVILLLVPLFSWGQLARDTIRLKRELTGIAALDNRDKLYVADIQGTIYSQSLTDGTNDPLVYAPQRPSRVSLLDASNPLRIFAYYEDLQEYVLLDRFLTETSRYSLQSFTSFAGICAPSLNNRIWLLDLQQFALKKIDPLRNTEEINIPLRQVIDPDDFDVTYLREYQNLLFMLDGVSGIYVFDNIGNLLSSFPVKNVSQMSFSGDWLHALSGYVHMSIDIYTGDRKEEKISPETLQYFCYGKEEIHITRDGIIRIH